VKRDSGIHVVVSAYQRPEKLQARYAEIATWGKFSKIIFSIDGLRENSDIDEKFRRERVVEVAEKIATEDNSVEVLVWNVNTGVNNHLARLFSSISQTERIIFIEDDVGVDHTALDFLHTNISKNDSLAVAAHSFRNHVNLNPTNPILTLFPAQWGIALTLPVMESYLRVIKSKKIERRFISKVFKSIFHDYLSSFQIQSLTQWWFNHFFFCEKHGNWADALIQYSVYANGGTYTVPGSSLIFDDNSINDIRSMNPRQSASMNHYCSDAVFFHENNQNICLSCELHNSRIHEAKLRNLIGATKHRKIVQARERQPY
jgi:hypothetical protein